MKISDILALNPKQLRTMPEKELRKVTQQLADAANKRVKRLVESGYAERSPALAGKLTELNGTLFRKDTGTEFNVGSEPFFSTKGLKKRSDVRAEFSQVKSFLQSKTSSTAGTKKVIKEIQKRMGRDLTPAEWKAYRKIEEMYGGAFPGGMGSTDVQKLFVKASFGKKGASDDDMIDSILAELENQYENIEGDEFTDSDPFYSIDYGEDNI